MQHWLPFDMLKAAEGALTQVQPSDQRFFQRRDIVRIYRPDSVRPIEC